LNQRGVVAEIFVLQLSKPQCANEFAQIIRLGRIDRWRWPSPSANPHALRNSSGDIQNLQVKLLNKFRDLFAGNVVVGFDEVFGRTQLFRSAL
jgi:hypothetical protein